VVRVRPRGGLTYALLMALGARGAPEGEVTPHPPGAPGCVPERHCYGCDVDESGPAWRVCPECFHRYRSPRELRKAYRREWRAAKRLGYRWHTRAWMALTARASRITFCQECLHDF
jgi:hypothetical protein